MKNKNNYYDMLNGLISYSYEASILLKKIFHNYDKKLIDSYVSDVHAIENDADHKLHDFINKLAAEFITPIDRMDLMDLASRIDDITDSIDDILLNLYMYDVSKILPEAISFADALIDSCEGLKLAFVELPNFKKSKTFEQHVTNVKQIEAKMDILYVNSIRQIVVNKDFSSISKVTWIKLLDKLEKCCDTCKTVANTLQNVAMSNS